MDDDDAVPAMDHDDDDDDGDDDDQWHGYLSFRRTAGWPVAQIAVAANEWQWRYLK
jgi:hypothetical protein